MNRLTYEGLIESGNFFSACPFGFRKGQNQLNSILCLEPEIRKAQINKEVLVGVFFEVEIADI